MKLSIFPKSNHEKRWKKANIRPYMWACPCSILAPIFNCDVTSTAWVRATKGKNLRELAMPKAEGKEDNYVQADLSWTQKSRGQPKRWCFHTVERRVPLCHYRPLPCLNKALVSKWYIIVNVILTFYEGCKVRSRSRLEIAIKPKMSVMTALRPWISRTKKGGAVPRMGFEGSLQYKWRY